MATAYTSLLGFALPVTGELNGTWGDVVNSSITSLVEDSIAGSATASVTSGNWTLTTTGSGAANQARVAILIPTGTPGTTRNIIAPSSSKAYIVNNQSNGAVVVKGSATTGATVAAGTTALVAWNGSDFVLVAENLANAIGTLAVSNGGTGATTLTGYVKGTGTSALTASSTIPSTDITGLGTMSTQNANSVAITGGSINGTTIGATTASTGAFTTLSASSTVSGTGFSTYLASPPAIGGTAAAAGSFTTLTTSSTVTHNGGTANGVAYLNGSKVLTTGSALTFDGTNFAVGGAAVAGVYKLQSVTSSGNNGISVINGGNTSGDYAALSFTQSSAQKAVIYTNQDNLTINTQAGATIFQIGAAEQMRLTSTGLGIGTSSPNYSLEVVKNNANIAQFYYADGTDNRRLQLIGSSSGVSINVTGSTAGNNLMFQIVGTERMRIHPSGGVSIGNTTDPGATNLSVTGTISGGTVTGTVDGTNALGFRTIPQNSQSAAYTLVLTDSGKHIFHPSADTTARTFTIPANSSVAYPIGTAVTFVNQNGAGVITIAITTDTMRLAGAGTTGSRTLAANGVATAIKVTSTEWIISGTGLT